MFSIGNYAFISYFKKIQVSDRSIQRCPKLCSLLTFLKLKTLAFDPLVSEICPYAILLSQMHEQTQQVSTKSVRVTSVTGCDVLE